MFKLVKNSVGMKIGLTTVAIAAIMLLAVFFVFYQVGGESFQRFERRSARSAFHNLKTVIDNRLGEETDLKGHHYNFLTELKGRNKTLQTITIFDRHGKPKLTVGNKIERADIVFRKNFEIQPSCKGCHGTGERTLGSLAIGFRSVGKSEFNAVSWAVIIAATCFLIGVLLVIVFIVRHMLSKPLQELCRTVEAAEEGYFLTRARIDRSDEIGLLSQHFNKLLEKITDLKVDIIDTDRELEWAQQELALKKELEEKNLIIESTNQELEKTLGELRVLFEITQTINSTIELDQVMNKMSTQISQALSIKEFAVFLVDEKSNRLQLKSTYGFFEDDSDKQFKYRNLRDLSRQVIESRAMVYIDNVSRDGRFHNSETSGAEAGSHLCLPIQFMQRIIGTLCFFRARSAAFDDEEITLLQSIAYQAAMAIGNAQMFHRTKELSIHDELTSIYNRRFLQNRLEMEWSRSKRFDQPLSLLIMDIDHFKQLNDKFGHLYGDEVLKKVAKLLLRSVRRVDTVARFGGEEFVVLLPKTKKGKAVEVADKLRGAIERTRFPKIDPETAGPTVTISVGVATFPRDAKTTEEILDKADQALYRAKAGGRNQVIAA